MRDSTQPAVTRREHIRAAQTDLRPERDLDLDSQSNEGQAAGFRVRLQQEDQFPGLIHGQKPVGAETRQRHLTAPGGEAELAAAHPLRRAAWCSGRPAQVRLLSRAVGMMGMARTGWTSTPAAGQTAHQLRLNAAASAVWETSS